MLHVFVYDAVYVKKIVVIFSAKPLSYPYVQVAKGLSLGYLLIYGAHVKPNFKNYCKWKLWLRM